jgi:hypothetical protein
VSYATDPLKLPNLLMRLTPSDSPTEREERNHHDGSSPKRVPGKQGEIPLPLGRKRRQRLLGSGLALGYLYLSSPL